MMMSSAVNYVRFARQMCFLLRRIDRGAKIGYREIDSYQRKNMRCMASKSKISRGDDEQTESVPRYSNFVHVESTST